MLTQTLAMELVMKHRAALSLTTGHNELATLEQQKSNFYAAKALQYSERDFELKLVLQFLLRKAEHLDRWESTCCVRMESDAPQKQTRAAAWTAIHLGYWGYLIVLLRSYNSAGYDQCDCPMLSRLRHCSPQIPPRRPPADQV